MLRLAIIAMCFLSANLAAKEVEVQITPDVPGVMNVPATQKGERRAVLLLHGWNSQMNEVGDLYKNLASRLEDEGIASLRISFSGEGTQSNYVVTATFDSRIMEAKKAFEFLKQRYPDATYGVVGFSLGGLTAMGILDEYADAFHSVVLWSAAEQMRINGDPAYDNAAMKAMREGRAVYKDFTDITLTREHLSSFVGVDVHHNLRLYQGSLLSIRGDQDFLPSRERKWFEISPSSDKSFLLIGGANHIFNVLDTPQPGYPARVLDTTTRWLVRTLEP